jgi:hypothetical protein
MREPSSSSTDLNDPEMHKAALRDRNLPLCVLAASLKKEAAMSFLSIASQLNFMPLVDNLVANDPEDSFLLNQFLNNDERFYKTKKYLIEKYSDKVPQKTLNNVLETIASKSDDRGAIWESIPLLVLLHQKGAQITPDVAQDSLNRMLEYPFVCDGCNDRTRAYTSFLLSRGARFENRTCLNDCVQACYSPCLEIDLLKIGKPFSFGGTIGSVIGCALGVICCPCTCCTLVEAAKKSLDKPFDFATPPTATLMEHRDSLDPVLLSHQ